MADENDLQKALEDLTDAIKDANPNEKDKKGDAAKKREEERKSKKIKDNTKAVIKNTLGLIGLTGSMFTLKGMVGDVGKMNSKVSQSLGQLDKTTLGSRFVTEKFNNASVGMTQAIDTFSTAVELGISEFSDGALRFSAQMKVLGLDNKQAMKLMRFNTQGLGATSESSARLVDTLVSTAAANKDSISGLIDAIASMKEALIGTSVELGPKAAENAQKIAAMMSQGNSELQQVASKFVTSFLTGTEGFQKAARLGVTFTGQESLEEMTVKFEQILGRISELDPGGQVGSQYTFEAFEKGYNLSRQDFFLQKQIGTTLKELKQTNTEQLAADVSKISIDQAYQKATYATQSLAMEFAEGAAKGINKISDWFGPWGITVLGFLGSIVGFLSSGGIGNIFGGGFRKMGGIFRKGFGRTDSGLRQIQGDVKKSNNQLNKKPPPPRKMYKRPVRRRRGDPRRHLGPSQRASFSGSRQPKVWTAPSPAVTAPTERFDAWMRRRDLEQRMTANRPIPRRENVGSILRKGFDRINRGLRSLGGRLLSGFRRFNPLKSNVAQRMMSKTATRAVGKGIFKSFLKKIPVVGAVAGLGFAAARAMKGDWKGAMGEAASGLLASVPIPGVGTAASLAVDAALAARDARKAGEEAKKAQINASTQNEEDSRNEMYRQSRLDFEEKAFEQGRRSLQAQQETSESTRGLLDLELDKKPEKPSYTSIGPEKAIVEKLNQQILEFNKLIALAQKGNSLMAEGSNNTRRVETALENFVPVTVNPSSPNEDLKISG